MIVELLPFDLETAPEALLTTTAGLWAALPRLNSSNLPVARLILIADTLDKEDILADFRSSATPESYLPPGVLAYRIEYENYLDRMAREVRYIRCYLVMETSLDERGIIGLLGAYGLRARPLDHELPRPFNRAESSWEYLESDQGLFAMLGTVPDQGQATIHPRLLHNLFSQDFPVYAALQIYTYPQAEVMRMLNEKAAMATYGAGKTVDSIREAEQVQTGISAVSDAISMGEALHTFRLYAMVSGRDRKELNTRQEIVRGALGLKLEKVYAPGDLAAKVFSAEPLDQKDGSPLTTSGLSLLTGSALSYRRRTETHGIMLGMDRNQAPVILDVFHESHASYNMVILGQTGSGKTFASLMLMMRHLLMGVRLIMIDPQGNINLDFLGEEVVQRNVIGTGAASVNILDVIHEEAGAQVEMAIAMLRLLKVHTDTPLERALLDEGLVSLYTPLWEGKEKQAPLLTNLHRWMSERAGKAKSSKIGETAETMALALQAYVTGSQREMFGKPTSIDFSLEHAVTIFDVSKLPPQEMGENLRSALLSILVANINLGIRRRRVAGDRAPILFFVDEMGMLMRDPVLAAYISGEYKTARARLVGMIVADQDLHSLLGPRDSRGLHHGIPILANAANTLIFNQKDNQRGSIQEHFPALPESLVDTLPVLPRGTCLAQFADGDLLMVNIVPSPMDLVILSSRLQDREKAKAMVEQMRKEIKR